MPFNSKTAKEAGQKSSRQGSPNKLSKSAREAFATIIEMNAAEFEKRLLSLPDKDFCEVYIKAAEFVLPKLARTESTVTAMAVNPYADWTDEQIADELERLEGLMAPDTGRYGSAFDQKGAREPEKTDM